MTRRTGTQASPPLRTGTCANRTAWRTAGRWLPVVGCVVAAALALGGCPGAPSVVPIGSGGDGSGATLPGGNRQPVISFLEPVIDTEISPGDSVDVTFFVSDADDNAVYSVFIDPDPTSFDNNIIDSGFENDVLSTGRTITLSTAGWATGTYSIRGTISDGVNPIVTVTAPGRLLLLPPGFTPRNRPPFVQVIQPQVVQGVIQGDQVTISYCTRDPDSTANVLILLDGDQDPSNDITFNTAAEVQAICSTALPRKVGDAILLACAIESDCAAPANATQYTLTFDVGDIPPRADGQPWRVRVDVTDTKNPTVHAYAAGGISPLGIVNTAVVDVGQVGRSIAGAVFQGFDAGARTGNAFTHIPDLDGDGADEFLIVEQFGRPFEIGPVGAAELIYGRGGSRFGGVIPLNSIATTIPGVRFTMPYAAATEGITNVATVPDLEGDGHPEILFGMPRIERMNDPHNDNPCGSGECYPDLRPNPSNYPNTSMGDSDSKEAYRCQTDDDQVGFLCSNDQNLSVQTPIISGYTLYVDSADFVSGTALRNSTVSLGAVGQHSGDSDTRIFPWGMRFRGAWYESDTTQTDWPYRIVPTTRFGQTVASMPDLTSFSGPAVGPDGQPEILISAPDAVKGRGQVFIHAGQGLSFFDRAAAQFLNSIPHYYCAATDACFDSRGLVWPYFDTFTGAAVGDHLGYAWAAGDFNLDGNQDILMGAPGGDRDGRTDNGVVYIVFGRLDFSGIDFAQLNPPRVEIHGNTTGDGIGAMNKLVDDMNGDGLPDIVLGAAEADVNGLTDAGEVDIVFGGRLLTGENIFRVSQIATNQLPGTRFLGTQSGGMAGAYVASAGDFNADQYGDLLIVAPNETRVLNSQTRRGVVYLVFGGTHLINKTFNLTQVGTETLPGIIFVSPYQVGTADAATIECAEAAGDVDGDGFADILLGIPTADYINPSEPSQRRIDAGEAYLIYGTNAITPIGP